MEFLILKVISVMEKVFRKQFTILIKGYLSEIIFAYSCISESSIKNKFVRQWVKLLKSYTYLLRMKLLF